MQPIKIRNKNDYAIVKDYLIKNKWSKKAQKEVTTSKDLTKILKEKKKDIIAKHKLKLKEIQNAKFKSK